MHLELRNIIPFIIIFQGTLFGIVLLTHRGTKKTSNRLLATFLLLIATQFLFVLGREVLRIENLIDIMLVFGFSYGPVLFLYSKSLIYSGFKITLQDTLHFLPAIVTLFLWLSGTYLRPYLPNLMYLSIIAYLAYSFYLITKYRVVMKNTRATVSQADLRWLQWILIIFTVVISFDIIEYLIPQLKSLFGITLVHILLLIMISWIFYKGLKQPHIFQGITPDDEALSHEIEKTYNPVDPISDVTEEEIQSLLSHLEEKKPYTDLGISLKDLADQLGMSDRRLSQLINNHFNKNFMTFINDYRIELAKARLANPKDEKETISEIMYEVGFNSKSSFNTLFKRQTGCTPSEYKKKVSM